MMLPSSNVTCNMHHYENSNIFVEKYLENVQINTIFISIHDLFSIFCQPTNNVDRIALLQNSSIGCSRILAKLV